jgi:hypothetical protein
MHQGRYDNETNKMRLNVSECLIYIVCLLHVSATIVAILREVHNKAYIYKAGEDQLDRSCEK